MHVFMIYAGYHEKLWQYPIQWKVVNLVIFCDRQSPVYTSFNPKNGYLMTGSRYNLSPPLEILTGLALFDAGTVTEERIREFRRFGMRLDRDRADAAPLSDGDKIRAWYHEFMPREIRDTAGIVFGYLRLVSLVIVILGFLTGTGAAGYLFYYDGTAPVNVLPVLTFFAFLPLLLLLLSVGYSLIGSRGTSHLPPVFRWIEGPVRTRIRKTLNNAASGMSKADTGITTGSTNTVNDPMHGDTNAHQDAHSQMSASISANEIRLVHSEPVRYFLKQNLQLAGAAYLTGALIWMLLNVITTDLAFSWSSTLELRGETLYSITQTISAPWSRIVPGAVVDAETVETTRFFRAERGDLRTESGDFRATSSGRWWPFIFMTILVYGFLPKAIAFAWYRWRLGKSTETALVSSDSGMEILGYMEEPLITTRGDDRGNTVSRAETVPSQRAEPSGTCVVLFWGLDETDTSGIARVLNRRILSARHIGGLNSTEKDRQIIMDSARLSMENGHCDILVLVPYWESPTIRLEKKLHALLGENQQSRIIIMPVIEESVQNKQANEINWRTRVDQINRTHGRKRVFLDVRNILDSNRLTSIT